MSSITTSTTPAGAEQLTLLAESGVNARFQLSRDTRARGLRHIAEIRQMLAASNTANSSQDQRAA